MIASHLIGVSGAAFVTDAFGTFSLVPGIPITGSGGVSLVNTLDAYEGVVWITADSTLYTADNDVVRVNTATFITDAAAFTGTVAAAAVTGTLAATEAASDVAAFAGDVVSCTGTLAATEAGDTAAFTSTVVWFGTLAATEASDVAAFAGTVAVAIPGVIDATENTADNAAFAGQLGVIGTLAASEAGDTAAFSGYLSLVDEKVGILDAYESGGYSGAIEPTADSTLITADQTIFTADLDGKGGDTAHFVGELVVGAVLAAMEAADVASFAGESVVTGVLAAAEARDVASFTLSTIALEITGVLAAHESSDTAHFAVAKWEAVEEGDGLRNEVQRTVWLAGRGGRVTWLEGEQLETDWLQNSDPEMVYLEDETIRITELR